jgi:uncharacterized protein (UPF0335 family)
MTSNTHISVYARELAGHLREIASTQEIIKDLIASAKDAGINVKALRKVAREMVMESDKRAKLYEDYAQLEMFRETVGLTQAGSMLEAAE